MENYFLLNRKLFENKLWFSEPFSKAQAWIDLIGNANYKDGSFWVRGNEVKIKRGQLGWSEVTMAKRWNWSRKKVRNFLKWLKKEQQIEQQKYKYITSITTIINYDKYQCDTAKGTAEDTAEEQQKNSRGYITKERIKKDKRKILVSKDTKAFGNADVNFVIHAFKEVFGFDPATHRGQNARQTAWAYSQKLRKIIREKKGADFTGADELFRKATMKFFEWVRCQEWSEGVVSLRPMLVHLNKFLQSQK